MNNNNMYYTRSNYYLCNVNFILHFTILILKSNHIIII